MSERLPKYADEVASEVRRLGPPWMGAEATRYMPDPPSYQCRNWWMVEAFVYSSLIPSKYYHKLNHLNAFVFLGVGCLAKPASFYARNLINALVEAIGSGEVLDLLYAEATRQHTPSGKAAKEKP